MLESESGSDRFHDPEISEGCQVDEGSLRSRLSGLRGGVNLLIVLALVAASSPSFAQSGAAPRRCEQESCSERGGDDKSTDLPPRKSSKAPSKVPRKVKKPRRHKLKRYHKSKRHRKLKRHHKPKRPRCDRRRNDDGSVQSYCVV